MEIGQTTISRNWIILHEGRRYCVNYTESDWQFFTLGNRDNWLIQVETKNGLEEYRQVQENARLALRLISFCIDNWDYDCNHKVWDQLPVIKNELKSRYFA